MDLKKKKTAVFPGGYGRIGENTAWADTAGLGSIGLTNWEYSLLS